MSGIWMGCGRRWVGKHWSCLLSSFRAELSGDPEPSGAREREPVRRMVGEQRPIPTPGFRRRRGAAGFRVCEPLRVSPPGMTIAR